LRYHKALQAYAKARPNGFSPTPSSSATTTTTSSSPLSVVINAYRCSRGERRVPSPERRFKNGTKIGKLEKR
jgi:hypothetical protein